MIAHLETSEGQHKAIYLKDELKRLEFLEKCKFNLENIKKVKDDINLRSKYLIEVILKITEVQLSKIVNNSDQIKNILKNNNFSDEIIHKVEKYGNIKMLESNLYEFQGIAAQYLTVFINESNASTKKT